MLKKLSPFLNQKLVYYTFFFFLLSHSAGTHGLSALLGFLPFALSLVLTGVFGYVSNDIADAAGDRKAGKPNIALSLTTVQKLFLLVLLAGGSIFSLYYSRPSTLPYLIAELALLSLYAFPPIRLKEKGFAGVVTDSLYAYVVPSVILLVYTGLWNDLYWKIFLPSLGLLIGLKNILNHQLEDLDNDIISDTKTFVRSFPDQAPALAVIFTIAANAVCMAGTCLMFAANISLPVKIVFTVISAVLLVKVLLFAIYREQKYIAGSPDFDILYYGSIGWSLYLLWSADVSVLLLIPCLLLPNIRLKIRNTIYIVFRKMIYIVFREFIYRTLSFTVNYSLYYSCLLIGIDLKERARKRNVETAPEAPPVIVETIPVEEKNVHGLWIGDQLSPMELLTIRSFIRHGYTFHLWVYQPLRNELPESCVCCDANEIIPAGKVFKYRYASQFGTGKGSYAGFSDIFRYKLLHDKGGWWMDMDVTCLKPFDTAAPYFFRSHHDLLMVGNIMKAPRGSALMMQCYLEASAAIDENNRDWHKPIEILISNIVRCGLEKYIVAGVSNTDEWHKIRPFVSSDTALPCEWYFLHWCNEVWRTNGYAKDEPLYTSAYGQLLMEYGLIPALSLQEQVARDKQKRIRLRIDKAFDFI